LSVIGDFAPTIGKFVIGITLQPGCKKLRVYEQCNSDEEWNQADEAHRLLVRNPTQENHQADANCTSD
jgi:hypothetical protein